jgi:hypothetical protein
VTEDCYLADRIGRQEVELLPAERRRCFIAASRIVFVHKRILADPAYYANADRQLWRS